MVLHCGRASDGSSAPTELQAVGQHLHDSADHGNGPAPAALGVVAAREREGSTRPQRCRRLRAHSRASTRTPTAPKHFKHHKQNDLPAFN